MTRSAAGQRKIIQVKVSLQGCQPPIWRRLQVPATITLDELHGILQIAFDWDGFHLHVFETNGRQYGDPDPELEFRSELGVPLSQVAKVGSRMRYIYDFGDDWEHVIEIEKSLPAEPGVQYPRCTGGRRAAPPEDCGGIPGYEELLRRRESALQSPSAVPNEDDDEYAILLDGFDPAAFDADEITDALHQKDDETEDLL